MSRKSSQAVIKVSIKEAKAILKEFAEKHLELGRQGAHYSKYTPIFLRSEPGIGKTSICAQTAEELTVPFYPIQASVRESVDLSGLPSETVVKRRKLNGDTEDIRATSWLAPDFFTRPAGTFYLIDEITKAPHMMGAVSMLAFERYVGEHRMPDGSTIVFAGNREEDNAGDMPLPSQLADRLMILDVFSTYKHFLEHSAERGLNPLITGYVAHYGQRAFSFNPESECNATYRSWSMVNNVLDKELSATARAACLAGYVGNEHAQQFMSYLAWNADMDPPEYIIANPTTARVPTGESAIGKSYAIVSALIGHANVKTIGNIMTYLSRLNNKELVVYAVRDMMLRDPKVAGAPALRDWKLKNSALFTPVV